MTLRIKITHDEPSYPANVEVFLTDRDGKPRREQPDAVLQPGESFVTHVHSGQHVLVKEQRHDV
jgi:hypothetical protein